MPFPQLSSASPFSEGAVSVSFPDKAAGTQTRYPLLFLNLLSLTNADFLLPRVFSSGLSLLSIL